MPGQTRMTQAESRRRQKALITALETGVLGTLSLSSAARYVNVRHGSIQRWVRDVPEIRVAWQRAENGFRLGERPELPDFATFRRDYFGHDTPQHQQQWLDHIEAHPTTGLWLPPGAGKTSFALELVAYRLISNRDLRFLIVCANETEARKRVDWLQTALTDHAMYESAGRPSLVADFGPFQPKPGERSRLPWTRGHFTITGRSEPAKDFSVQAIGLRGKMYGSRLDMIILDDIVEDWAPEQEQERIISWLLGRVQSRLPADGKVAMLATRVHEQDLYSHFLDDSNEWTSSWAKLQTPAILDSGESYWPKMWPLEELERRRESMRSRDWALIYQQEAIGLPDSPFPMDVLEASKDSGRMVGSIPAGLPVVVGVDPATEGTCAIVVLAIDRMTKKRYIVDVIAKHGLGQREAIKSEIFYAVRRYGAVRCMVEENFGQLGTDPDLKRQLHLLGCSLERFDTTNNRKYDAQWGVLGTAGRFAAGLFSLPDGPGASTAMRPFVDELALWRAGRRGRQDRVMALWFADSCAEKLGIFRKGLPTRPAQGVPGWVRSSREPPGWVEQALHRRPARGVDEDEGVTRPVYKERVGGRPFFNRGG